MRLRISVALLVVAFAPIACFAQALSDKVPGDAIIYIGWRGASNPGPGYDQSHLKAILDASQLPQLLNQSLPALLQRIAQYGPQAQQITTAVQRIAAPLWNHPTAFYFGGIDMNDPQHPLPKIALYCDAGNDAPALVEQLNGLIAMAEGGPVKVMVDSDAGGLVTVHTVWTEQGGKPASMLSQAQAFQTAMAQVGKEPTVAVYVDFEAANKLIDQAVNTWGDPDSKQYWPKVHEASGLNQLQRLAWTDTFEGKDWCDQAFVVAPGPHHGLLTVLDVGPLGDDILKRIPGTAVMAGAGQLDLGKLVAAIRAGITQVDADAGKQADDAINQVNSMIGIDVQKDLLDLFGPEWAYFSDPAANGYGQMGLTLMNHCKEPERLETSLTKLEDTLNQVVHQQLAQTPVTVAVRQVTINGMHVHELSLPIFAPSWTIHDGMLYFGLYPQVVVSAAARPAGENSLLENPNYQDVRKRLGDQKATGVMFVDLPKVAPMGYQNLLVISQLFTGAGDLFGLDSPPMVVPPLNQLTPNLVPEGGVSWTDDAGWHIKTLSSFPGDDVLASGGNFGPGEVAQIISAMASLGAMTPHAVVAPTPPPPAPANVP